MAHMWKVGDKAVCVALSLPDRPVPSTILRLGKVYNVVSVRWSNGDKCVAIGLEGVYSKGPLRDWHADAFCPIVKADDDFIAKMRSLKPKVKQ